MQQLNAFATGNRLVQLGFFAFALAVYDTALSATDWKQSCQDWATFRNSDIELNNNTWGKQQEKQYRQCILQHRQHPRLMGWKWSWPDKQPGVKAYPSLIYGHKPWNEHSTTKHLPQQISELKQAKVSFSTRMEYQGAVNLLLEAWLTESPIPSSYSRTSEIAIHLMQHKWPGQGGSYYDSVQIGEQHYDVYINHKMVVPGDDHTWSYLSFVNTGTPLLTGEIDLKAFIDYLLQKQMITPKEYLASIELGNEIEHGKGESIVDYFHLDVQSTPES